MSPIGNSFFNVLGLVVILAIVAATVGGSNSSKVIQSMGNAFSGSIQAALGHTVSGNTTA